MTDDPQIIDLYELADDDVSSPHRESLRLVKGWSVFLRADEIAPDIA